MLDLLKKECSLTGESDIASGTGIFTRMLLENGHRVLGVEPNADMRHAAEEFLRSHFDFTSVAGSAEATTLADHRVTSAGDPVYEPMLRELRRVLMSIASTI